MDWKSILFVISLMNNNAVMDIVTYFDGLVMGLKRIIGWKVVTSRILKHWTSGWPNAGQGWTLISTILFLPQPASSFPTGFWHTHAAHCNYVLFSYSHPCSKNFFCVFIFNFSGKGEGVILSHNYMLLFSIYRCHLIIPYKDPLRIFLHFSDPLWPYS